MIIKLPNLVISKQRHKAKTENLRKIPAKKNMLTIINHQKQISKTSKNRRKRPYKKYYIEIYI